MWELRRLDPLAEFSLGDIVVAIGSTRKYAIQSIDMDMKRSDPCQFTLFEVGETRNRISLPGWVMVGDWLKIGNMFKEEDDDENVR